MNHFVNALRTREKLDAMFRLDRMQAQSLSDPQALTVPELYPAWAADTAYEAQYIVSRPNGYLYRCQQAHTSRADWLPEATPALYDAFGLDESGYPVWSQPSGAHDAYNTGDIVNYNGTLYKSLIDGNVWSPEAYPQGWEVYSE